MNRNEAIITTFYEALGKLDYKTMQSCYDESVIFYDPVFEDLVDNEVKWMWELLCLRASGLSVTFENVRSDDEYGSCDWTATYRFPRTGRTVVNRVKAHMRFHNGKIIEHSDQFRLSQWCRQAFGLRGWLFGTTGWMQKKVRRSAQESLYRFIQSKQAEK